MCEYDVLFWCIVINNNYFYVVAKDKKKSHVIINDASYFVLQAKRTVGTVMVYNIIGDAQEILNRIFDAILNEHLKEEDENRPSLIEAQRRAAEEAEYERVILYVINN